MIFIIRQCKSCGADVEITDENHLVISTANETMYFCEDCLFANPSFKHLASKYVMDKANDLFLNKEDIT